MCRSTSSMFFPSLLFANGGDVLILMWLEIALVIAVGLLLTFIKRSYKGKVIIGLLYMISVVLTLWATSNIPYTQNILMINAVCIGVPTVFMLLGVRLTHKS